jgi:WD40 repeat protein
MDATGKRALLILISLFVVGTALAATPQTIVWQASAGKAIAFSPDAQLMLTGIQVRHTSDGSLVRTFKFGYTGGSVNSAAFSPDGTLAALGIQAFNQNLFLFRVADGVKLAGPISAHNNGTTSVAFSPDGQFLVSAGRDGTAKLWHLPDMRLVRTYNAGTGYRPRIFAVLFTKDGSMLVLGGQGGVQVFRVSDGQLLAQLTTVATISLAFSPDGMTLASGSDRVDQYGQCTDCTIKMWRWANGTLSSRTIPGNNNAVTSLAFSPDQNELAAGAGDRTYSGSVRFFNGSTGQLLGIWLQDANNSGSYVTSVAYAPFGRLFAYGRADGVVTAAFDPF